VYRAPPLCHCGIYLSTTAAQRTAVHSAFHTALRLSRSLTRHTHTHASLDTRRTAPAHSVAPTRTLAHACHSVLATPLRLPSPGARARARTQADLVQSLYHALYSVGRELPGITRGAQGMWALLYDAVWVYLGIGAGGRCVCVCLCYCLAAVACERVAGSGVRG
jgi:hypothetical protein